MKPGSIGARFERHAEVHLERAGLKRIARNWRTRFGEIDLVMRERDVLVFVEVRYRRHPLFGGGVESIGSAKRGKIIRAAQGFLQAHPELAALPCRFDVVAFDGDADPAHCDWRRAAFEMA